jgi:GNAT superfamily N-acetyltransferase
VADRFLHSDGAPAGSRSAGTHPWIGASYFGLAGVEPQAMNRGLGRLLVGHAETMARADGFPRIALSTVREFGLVDYYARFGYEVVSEREHPVGHWDFVVPHHYCEMVKTL